MSEQKSFIAMLALVVAAGLVLGMVAFNLGGAKTGAVGNASTTVASGNGRASASSGDSSQPESDVRTDDRAATDPSPLPRDGAPPSANPAPELPPYDPNKPPAVDPPGPPAALAPDTAEAVQ